MGKSSEKSDKAAGGRPEALELTDDIILKIEDLASKGATKAQIAAALGISETTLFKYQAEKPEFADAIKRGKAKGVTLFQEHLFNQSAEGKTAATIFALINLDPVNWKQRKDHTGFGDLDEPVDRIEIVEIDGRKTG